MKSRFITIEGVEGVGKSTVLAFISAQLKKEAIDFVVTREPGGTKVAEALRDIMLHHETEPLLPETELLLLFAGRAQHIAEVIQPALKSGKWVVCDRFVDASFAYQGGGRNIPMQHIEYLSRWIVRDCKPDLTLLLDAPVEIGLERLKKRGAKDRIEKENIIFFERVRQVYLDRAKQESNRFVVISANQSIEQVEKHINFTLKKIINTRSLT